MDTIIIISNFINSNNDTWEAVRGTLTTYKVDTVIEFLKLNQFVENDTETPTQANTYQYDKENNVLTIKLYTFYETNVANPETYNLKQARQFLTILIKDLHHQRLVF